MWRHLVHVQNNFVGFQSALFSPSRYSKNLFVSPLIIFELCDVARGFLRFKATLRVSFGGGRVRTRHFVGRQVLMC